MSEQILVQSSSDAGVDGADDIIKNVSPINYHVTHSPRPELTTMTNVVVVSELHTNGPPKNCDAKEIGDSDRGTGSQDGQVIDECVGTTTVTTVNPYEELFAKAPFCDDQTLRLVGPNGESQEIISREILNGEHHILTRNENGDHIITRFVIPDHKMMNASENAIYTTSGATSLGQATGDDDDGSDINQSNGTTTQIVYANSNAPMPNHITTSVVQYTDSAANKIIAQPQHIYTTASATTSRTVAATATDATAATINADNNVTIIASNAIAPHDMTVIENKEKGHIIYKTYVETVDDNKLPIYESSLDDGADDDKQLYEKQPIDLMYEEGGKTVIYTTSSDPKNMEIYASGNPLSVSSDGQTILQGALQYQYIAQQINGQTVYVLSEPAPNADIVASPQR